MHDQRGMGAQGTCICLACHATKPHEPGVPCREERCPKCGKAMVREGSAHHLAYLEKQRHRPDVPK
ncbi:MAG: hypothetical protein PHQ91_11040 [Thermoanaerobaculaceae bacterium]|nr:hypothetical protein [Thermoanaerobaculaceae bacterium]